MKIGIYNVSMLVATTPDVDVRTAWRLARAYARGMARADGVTGPDGWYRTANRDGFECGAYRATPMIARGGLKKVVAK